jgi:hypothetical protein
MNFFYLKFKDHFQPGATHGTYKFPNGWEISVVAGPEGSVLKGRISQDTFEVLLVRPNGNELEEPLYYQTPLQISSIMRVINML